MLFKINIHDHCLSLSASEFQTEGLPGYESESKLSEFNKSSEHCKSSLLDVSTWLLTQHESETTRSRLGK